MSTLSHSSSSTLSATPYSSRDVSLDIQIPPSSTTKSSVWLLYKEATNLLSVKSAAYSMFTDIWRMFLPNIVVGHPMTDLCWTCQKDSALIVRSANLSEEVKSEVNRINLLPVSFNASPLHSLFCCHLHLPFLLPLPPFDLLRTYLLCSPSFSSFSALSPVLTLQSLRAAEAHIVWATTEQSFYRTAVKECKTVVRHHFTHSRTFSPPPVGATLTSGLGPTRVHYSFKFAQQVHYPHNPLQPGPMYFKTELPHRRGIRQGEGCQHCRQSAASLSGEPCVGRE